MQLPDSMRLSKIGDLDIIEIDNQFARARIALFGAHILSFIPKSDNRDRLWMSNNAILDGKTPLRGGIPVCWPWFSDAHGQADTSLPSHGFLRTQEWVVANAHDTQLGSEIELLPSQSSGPGFSFHAHVALRVVVGKSLSVSLLTHNTDSVAFDLNCALHSYFSVQDIHTTQLQGLTGVYKDKTRNWQQFETPADYIFSQETDRIHLTTPMKVEIVEPQSRTEIYSSGHDSIVVWNPWDKAQQMRDMQDDGYQKMLCVETALTQTRSIQPNEIYRLTQEIY